MIPYSRQSIEEDDIQDVVDVLRSDWLTTGPVVETFEEAVAKHVGAKHGVAVSSGTAALHAAMYAAGIGPGDEVIVPAITFVATANAVVFQGGTPIFADVDPDTLLIDVSKLESRISPRTKVIVAVDYAGHPCDYDALRSITNRHNLVLIADACHSLGATYKGKMVGTLADLTVFSFHPVKHITTGEGGMILTDDPKFSDKMRRFRNHGISTDHRQRAEQGTWFYEMTELGYNYRITDFQCALGLSQFKKLPQWVERRREIADRYNKAFKEMPALRPLKALKDVYHSYHLYVIQLDLKDLKTDRLTIFSALREKGVGVNVHYIPVYLHPFYRKEFGTKSGLCPISELAYEGIISLPIFPGMTDQNIDSVSSALRNICDNN